MVGGVARGNDRGRVLASLFILVLLLNCSLVASAKILDPADPDEILMMMFPEFGGSVHGFSISVAKEGVVVDASLGLSGSMQMYPSVKTTVDFADNKADNLACTGNDSKRPPTEGPEKLQDVKATAIDVGKISASDNNRWMVRETGPWPTDIGGHPIAHYLYQHFELDITGSRNTLDKFEATWEGYGFQDKGVKPYMYGATLYIFSPKSSEWVQLATYSDNTGDAGDHTLKGTYQVTADDRDGFKGKVNILVMGLWSSDSNAVELATDYIKVEVTSHTVSTPSDLEVDVDNDGTVEHTYTGPFMGLNIFGRAEGFVDALQQVINGTDPDGSGGGNITVPINFTSATGGSLSVTLKTLDVDTPPRFMDDIEGLSVEEDGALIDAIDLYEHFSDDHDVVNLTYEVAWEEMGDKVHATIRDGRYVDILTVAQNWSGEALFRVSAHDRFDQTAVSNNFSVLVTPANDMPVLEPIGDLEMYEDQAFSLKVEAWDIDGDTLAFSDDTPLFDIDPVTGYINVTPDTRHIGEHQVNITVSDGRGGQAHEIINIVVFDVNEAPTVTLYLPTNDFIVTMEKVRIVWSAKDPEEDELTYDIYVDRGSGMALEASGIPDTDHDLTGLKNGTTYRWTVEAFDGRLRSTRPGPFSFKVEIEEPGGGGGEPNGTQPNQPPSVTLISPKKGAEIGTLMPTLSWKGFDPDTGDLLTYDIIINDKDGATVHKTTVKTTYHTVMAPLKNNERYSWTVVPFDGEDYGICVSGTWYFTINRTGQQESSAPVINVTVVPEGEIDEGTKVTFDASGSHDPDGMITLYIWTFGDGTTLTGATHETVEHTFEDSGDFNVSLVLFDNDGRSSIWAQTIVVKDEDPPPPPPPPPPTVIGMSMDQLLIALLITVIAVVFGTTAAIMAYRRYKYGKFDVEQIFLIYHDGRLISHVGAGAAELEANKKQDKEIMGSMLAAVQDFVQHSLKDQKANGTLKVLEYGDYNIVIERGKRTFLAVFATGNVTKELRQNMRKVLNDVEGEYGGYLKKWDGDTDRFKAIEFKLIELV